MRAPVVIIPTFNAPPPRLVRAVSSALACGASRVIVVDDGSSPAARVPDEPRVERVAQDNAGPSAARNRGLDLAPGEDVMFLDDDDELIPEGVARLRALAERLGACAAVGAKVHVHPDGRAEARAVPPEWAERVLPDPADVFRPIALFSTSGIFVRRDGPAAGVRFDPALRIGEDRDFLRRVAGVGAIGVSVTPAVRFTLHGGAGSNLSGPAHAERRIADHAVLLDRWCDGASAEHFRAATAWLANAASKARVADSAWRTLSESAARHGIRIPLRARLRRTVLPPR